jgi:hypothetical protein
MAPVGFALAALLEERRPGGHGDLGSGLGVGDLGYESIPEPAGTRGLWVSAGGDLLGHFFSAFSSCWSFTS